MAAIVKTIVSLLVCLGIADVIGVVVCTLFDLAPIRGNSGLLPFAIWLVLGVFCGLFHFAIAGGWSSNVEGDWTALPGAARTGTIVFWTSLAALVLLAAFFWRLYWSRGVEGEYYVPDSAAHTITFFLAVLGATWLGKGASLPDAKS